MLSLASRPIPTLVVEDAAAFVPEPGSAYLYGASDEQRCKWNDSWSARVTGVSVVEVFPEDRFQPGAHNELGFRSSQGCGTVPLRSDSALTRFWAALATNTVYLDITGIEASCWAALVRSAVRESIDLRVIYVEPKEYRFNPTPTEGDIFDLTDRLAGLAPLPGFARITEPDDADPCFVALLGFEGKRFAYVLSCLDPPEDAIVPVVGVPGFRPEFPFHAFIGNKVPLARTRAWRSCRFALAHCPFSLYYLLEDLQHEYKGALMQIAPLGTKPHMLGAIMFSLARERKVELIYDHPVRKAKCTEGVGRLLVYEVSRFLETYAHASP